MKMKGFKVFNPDWTCRGFKFEVGKIYEEDVKPAVCSRGFHFCEKAADCFIFYDFDSKNKVAEIEALGEVDSDECKSCTNKIHIIRELTWHEVLNLVNSGKSCTGKCNSGDCNSGNWNSGDCNSGNWNSGKWNSGDCNSGNWNSGDCNSGNWNSGKWNSGDYNSGNCNSGDWNRTSFSNGCFNTKLPKIFLFDKPSDWTYRDWFNSDARLILEQTEKKAEKQMWWDELSDKEKNAILSIPNFDRAIFKKITGIDVEGGTTK